MGFFDYLVNSAPIFAQATMVTLQLTLAALVLGAIIGLVFAMMKISKNRMFNCIADTYITVIRGTPLITQIFLIYYGLAPFLIIHTGYDPGAFWSAAAALAVHNGAYIAEIFRGGIQSIDRGQMEAARSLGMSYPLAMRRIVLPQAFKRVIPPLGNQFIIGLKDSSLAAFVTMEELFNIAMRRAAATGGYLEHYVICALYYLLLVIIFSFLVKRLEKRLDVENK